MCVFPSQNFRGILCWFKVLCDFCWFLYGLFHGEFRGEWMKGIPPHGIPEHVFESRTSPVYNPSKRQQLVWTNIVSTLPMWVLIISTFSMWVLKVGCVRSQCFTWNIVIQDVWRRMTLKTYDVIQRDALPMSFIISIMSNIFYIFPLLPICTLTFYLRAKVCINTRKMRLAHNKKWYVFLLMLTGERVRTRTHAAHARTRARARWLPYAYKHKI